MYSPCHISDDWTYKGMRVVWMENEFLKIGILVDRGADIFEFRHKGLNINVLLNLPGRLRNPREDFSQQRDTANQFEAYYYGGWQELLPNSPTFTYRGASLGQHGEVALIPWKYAILHDSPESVSLKVWTQPLRVPVLVEKILTLHADSPTLHIEDQLTNTSRTHLDLMWGHHVAFGLPFLREGAVIETNAQTLWAEPAMPPLRRFTPGVTTHWPQARNIHGDADDASFIPPETAPPYSDLAYLSGFEKEAYYCIRNPETGLGFRLEWEADTFPCLWYWTERYGMQDFPWWGECYTVGLEPWTSQWTPEPEKAIEKGEWLRLEAGEKRATRLKAELGSR